MNSYNKKQFPYLNCFYLICKEFKQGIIGWTWNRFKNITGLGLGSKDVNKTIEEYKNGKITYDEAAQTIEKYETKQSGIVNLAANIVSGFVTAAVTISTMGTGIATGAADYTIEAAAEEDVDFTAKGLAVLTLQNALAGGLIGGIANGASYGISYKKASNFNANLNKNSQAAVDIDSYVDAETGIKYKYDETTNTWIAQKKTD